MYTPKKRNLSDVEPDSSPDTSVLFQPKKMNPDKMTPESQATQSENLIPAIARIETKLNELLGLKDTIDTLQTGVNDLSSTVDSILKKVSDIEKEFRSVARVVEQCQQENSLLKRKLQIIEERQIKAEAYSRRDNLIFEGIQQTDNEDLEKVLRDTIRIKMKCPEISTMKFVRVHRLPGLPNHNE